MNIVSHILYPIAFAQSADAYRTYNRKAAFFNWKHLLLIGLSGGLPDILYPHLHLGSRYHSFTHSLWFLLAALSISFMLAWRFKFHRALIYFCLFALLFHLLCDMIAGGINIFAPSGKMIIARNYIPARYWIPLDVTALLFFCLFCLYSKCRARVRSIFLISGLVVGIGGAGLAFSKLDSETFFLKRISASQMSLVQLEKAQRVYALFEKWQAGTFEHLSNEYTEEIRRAMTPEFQESFFRKATRSFGDYQGIAFAEMVTARFNYPHILIYRFKASFSRTLQQPEIRISFDTNGKISSFSWSDKFNDRLMY
jgi:hypothetical protein